jgi:hypothetical protein
MKNKVYTGVWVPEKILSTKIKNGNERLLLAMIFELSKKGGCIASNKYFSKLLFLSESQISNIISKLNKKGVINHFVDKKQGNKRTITINNDNLYVNNDIPMCKNNDTLYVNSDTNIIEDKIIINTSTTTEKLKSNLDLIGLVCKEKNIDKEVVCKWIEQFVEYHSGKQKIWVSDTDLFNHFKSSIKDKQKEDIYKLEEEVNWFIERFNEISKRNFRVTPTIKKLFAKQFAVGYTGKEMRIAVGNMYSSSVENDFHIKSSFKFATPQYLLKDDNINKYLNVRWANNRDWKNITGKRERLN